MPSEIVAKLFPELTSRRTFLKRSSQAAIFATTFRRAYAADDSNTHFTLQDTPTPIYRAGSQKATQLTMCLPDTRIQAAVYEEAHKRFFVTQQKHGAFPTIVLSFVNWNPANETIADYSDRNGSMTLTDFGHGQNFGVTTDSKGTWIWIECGAIRGVKKVGRKGPVKICKFPWTGSGTYKSNITDSDERAPSILSLPGAAIYDLQPGAESTSCSIDPVTNELALHFNWTEATTKPIGTPLYTDSPVGFQFAIYDLKTLTSKSKPLYPLIKDLPSPAPAGSHQHPPNQGMTLMGNYIYGISGTGVPLATCTNGPDQGNAYITAIDRRTGSSINTHLTNAPDLNIREPEGIWIQRTVKGPRLMFCLTSGGPTPCAPNTPAGPQKLANFFYTSELTNTPFRT